MLPGKILSSNFIGMIKEWQKMWNYQVLEFLHGLNLVAGPGIRLQKLPSGTIISVTQRGGGGGLNGPYEAEGGPFAVTVITDPQNSRPRIRLHNSAGETDEAGLVTIGSYREMIPVQEWSARSGVVYLDITCDDEGDKYTILVAFDPKLPKTQDEKRYILRLAEVVKSDDGFFSVIQIHQVGDIEVLGRWVK